MKLRSTTLAVATLLSAAFSSGASAKTQRSQKFFHLYINDGPLVVFQVE